jgi:hypothetical protein
MLFQEGKGNDWKVCYERYLKKRLGCAAAWQRLKTGSVQDCKNTKPESFYKPESKYIAIKNKI